MPVKIAIASGKGGTGKTTVTVNLYHFLSNNLNSKVQIADCDVEEPNASIFFEGLESAKSKQVTQLIPFIDTDTCTFCRKCVDYCEFNAIIVIPQAQFAEVSPSLCHSCGACLYACPEKAIIEQPNEIGQINTFNHGVDDSFLIEGKLEIGSSMQTMVIKDLVKDDWLNKEVILYDAPPGTSCSVVATITQANYTILVTEPTPFGLHDLKLMVDLVRKLKKPFGVIINKADEYSNTYTYLKEERIEILAEIPFNINYAKSYAQGAILKNIPADIESVYMGITQKLKNKLIRHA
nr:ATP-binding protein [uncultured Carboxylicivirga sp.]